MPANQSNHPTFLTIAPRFIVQDLSLALDFYEQLGFQTTYYKEGEKQREALEEIPVLSGR